MRHGSLLALTTLLSSSLAGSCSSSQPPSPVSPDPAPDAAPDAAPSTAVVAAPVIEDGWTVSARARGVPHNSRINSIALSPSADAAATLDATGHVRVWSALDGSREPVPIAVRAASRLALARAGDELQVAIVDTARTLRLLSVSTELEVTPVFTGSPAQAVTDVAVLDKSGIAVILRSDRSLVFRSRTGRQLAQFDERAFRPKALLAASSNTVMAMEIDGTTVRLHRFAIEVTPSGARVKRIGKPRELAAEGFVDAAGMMSLSPDAKRFAAIRQDTVKNRWSLEVFDLESDAAPVVAELGTNASNTPFTVGFVASDKVVVRFSQGGGTHLIDAASAKVTTLPARISTNDVSRAIGRDRILAAVGSSLYSFQPSTGKSLYLSYRQFFPISAAASPSGRRFAYISGRDLYIDDRKETTMRWRELDEQFSLRYVAFTDEDHLLLLSVWGELRLIEWKSGAVVARHSGPGVVSAVNYDPARKLLALIPSAGQVWMIKIGGGPRSPSIDGPHIVADGVNRAGFLGGSRGALLWTLDGSNVLRTYTWNEIKSGVSRVSAELRGARITGIHPMTLDRKGRLISIINIGGRQMVGAYDGPEAGKLDAASVGPELTPMSSGREFQVDHQKPTTSVAALSVSAVHGDPSGQRLIIAAQGLASATDATSLEIAWSLAFPNSVGFVDWNSSGNVAGITTSEGVTFVKAASGEIVHRTCGPVFVVSEQPPQSLHGRSGFTQSICEAH